MNSSHVPDEHGIGNAVDIPCTNSKDRYELVELAQKFFKRIGIPKGSYGGCSFGCGSIKDSRSDVALLKNRSPSFQPRWGRDFPEGLLRRNKSLLDSDS